MAIDNDKVIVFRLSISGGNLMIFEQLTMLLDCKERAHDFHKLDKEFHNILFGGIEKEDVMGFYYESKYPL